MGIELYRGEKAKAIAIKTASVSQIRSREWLDSILSYFVDIPRIVSKNSSNSSLYMGNEFTNKKK